MDYIGLPSGAFRCTRLSRQPLSHPATEGWFCKLKVGSSILSTGTNKIKGLARKIIANAPKSLG
jgi:hypothetical protein